MSPSLATLPISGSSSTAAGDNPLGSLFLIGDHPSMRAEDFDRLYSEHGQALFGFLVYRRGDRVLAEDLVADTFERVLRTRARFDRRKGKEKT